MKINVRTSKTRALLFTLCFVIGLCILAGASMLTANAYTGNSGHLSREQLHTQTLATSVRTDTPAITVLMHGLSGRASHWSNDDNGNKGSITGFVKDSASIIEKMRDSVPDIKLYRAKFDDAFYLYAEYDGGNEEDEDKEEK